MDDDTFEQVRSIIVNHLGIEPSKVTSVASFIDDLGADSLDTIELVMAFERAFDIVVPDAAMEAMVTVQDAVDYIQQQRKPGHRDTSGP